MLLLLLPRTKLLDTKFNCKLFWVAQEGKLPESWLYEKSKLFSEGLLTLGRLPERLLFPRNKNPRFSKFSMDCGIWPVILLKLKSSKVNPARLEKFTVARLSDILQFLNIRTFKDVKLLINDNEELPFTISPIRKSVNLARLDKLSGIGPSKEFPWNLKTSNLVKFPIKSGIFPVKSLSDAHLPS